LLVGQSEREHRRAEALHQQRSAGGVGPVQDGAAVAVGEPEHGGLAVVDPTISPGHQDLEDGSGAVVQHGVGDECLGALVVGPADLDRPVPFQTSDDVGQFVDPVRSALCDRPIAHDGGQLDHARRRYSCRSPPDVGVAEGSVGN
jgi:hypothetical protein